MLAEGADLPSNGQRLDPALVSLHHLGVPATERTR